MAHNQSHDSCLCRAAQASAATAIASLSLTVNATAQSINVDFGPSDDPPSSTYAAAGVQGFWNSVNATNGSQTHGLKNLDGVATAVAVRQLGADFVLQAEDPETSGDDERLMDDHLATFDSSQGREACLFFSNMQPGWYEVLIYARMPAESTVKSWTYVDQEAGVPHYEVGGAWNGGHELGRTYSRHLALVTSSGFLGAHSGIVPGHNELDGAALNGIQIRQLPEPEIAAIHTMSIITGLLNGGDGSEVLQSDDVYTTIRSGFGQTLIDLHHMEVEFSAATSNVPAARMEIAVEGHISHVAGTAQVRVRNVQSGSFDVVDQFPVSQDDVTRIVEIADARPYVASDGEIDVRLRTIVFVPFFAFQFDTSIDLMEILVQ